MIMEFIIVLAVVTAGITLVVVGISVGVLWGFSLYRNKKAAIIVPAILAVIIGAIGPTDYASLGQWAYYILPTLLLAPPWVSDLCHRKRLKDAGYHST